MKGMIGRFKRGFYLLAVGWLVSFCASYTQQIPIALPSAPPTLPQQRPLQLPNFTSAMHQIPASVNTLGQSAEIGTHGNWYKKREWLLKANDVNCQIQDLSSQAEDLRAVFMNKYKEVDKILDNYYTDQGLQQGKVIDLFESINKYVEKQRKKEREALESKAESDIFIQNKIESIEEKMNGYKREFEQLKLDLKSIEDLDQSITERLKRFDEQIGVIDKEAEKAAQSVDSLWDVLDDQKAREQFYLLNNGTLEQVKAIYNYLKDDLFNDLSNVITTVVSQIEKNKEAIRKLESNGFIIKDRAQKLKKIKQEEIERLEREKKQKALEEKEKAEQKAKTLIQEEPQSFYKRLWNNMKEGWSAIYKIFVGVWDSLTSYWSKPPEKPEKKQGPVTTQDIGIQPAKVQEVEQPISEQQPKEPVSPVAPSMSEPAAQPQEVLSPEVPPPASQRNSQEVMPPSEPSREEAQPTLIPEMQSGLDESSDVAEDVPEEMPAAETQ